MPRKRRGMSNVVNTKYGDRGLVHLPPVQLSGSRSPVVNTLEYAYRPWVPRPEPLPTQSSATQPPAQQPVYGGQWYGGAPVSYASPMAQVHPSQVYGPGNLVPAPGQLGQLVQQANIPSMQAYNYGQYPMVGGGAPQGYQQYAQMPAVGSMGMQPPPGQQYQMPPQMYPYGQLAHGQERHIFYGPDGQVLPGPPPGFALDGSKPRNPDEYPHDFAIEGVLDYGRLRAVQLMDNTKRFPKIPEYLHRELLVKYKHYKRTYVRIVARGGEIHVHATPFVDTVPPVFEEFSGPDVRYEYVPVYVDDNGDIVNDSYGYGPNRGRVRDLELYRNPDRREPYRTRNPYSPEIGRRYDRYRSFDREYPESLPPGTRYRVADSPSGARTIINAERVKPVDRPSTNY